MGAAGMVGGRGASTPAEREYLNSVLNQTRQGPGANVPRVPAAEDLQGRGMDTPAEREFLRQQMGPQMNAINAAGNIASASTGPAMSVPELRQYGISSRGMDTPNERNFLANNMTPAQRQEYFQSFADEGINLTPGAGLARGLRGIDQAVTGATTAPGNLGENQLRNIASGNAYNAQGQINPYGLGLGQQMYMNPMGLLNY
jgi:hypothetical protein